MPGRDGSDVAREKSLRLEQHMACGTFRGLCLHTLSFCVSSSLTHSTCAAVHGCFRGVCCDRIRHRSRRAPPCCLFSASGSHYIFHRGGFAASVVVKRGARSFHMSCASLINLILLMVALQGGLERRMAGWTEHQQSESMSLGASLGASMSSMSQWGLIHPNLGWLAALTSLILTF
jgi:hypothetical protein